jgi:hypothetical protein
MQMLRTDSSGDGAPLRTMPDNWQVMLGCAGTRASRRFARTVQLTRAIARWSGVVIRRAVLAMDCRPGEISRHGRQRDRAERRSLGSGHGANQGRCLHPAAASNMLLIY